MRLILASTSPRRREILQLLGLPFEVVPPDFDEIPADHRPLSDEVVEFAAAKARSVARHHPADFVIGSDTMILLNGKKIGKPATPTEAKEILRFLSGKTHHIYTGVAIVDSNGPGLESLEQVSVEMRDYSEAEIERYIACGESLDKAGAYSIQGQGRALIHSIDGDYLAAVGMPLKPIAAYLVGRGIPLPVNVEKLYSDKPFLNWRSF